MEFSVTYEFAVNRRIPWDDDRDALRAHISSVRQHIAQHVSVEDVRVESNLSTARLALDLVAHGPNRQAVESDVRDLIGESIRECGAYHQGLFAADDELRMRPKLNTWSGLRTPTWRVRRSNVQLRRSVSKIAS
jgi:hypothetical protein